MNSVARKSAADFDLDQVVSFVDVHCEGETSRIVLSGVDVPGETMAEKRRSFESDYDFWRTYLLGEPRGTVTLCADVVYPSTDTLADWGYVIMESTDYPPMSGTNTINTATVLLEHGLVPMVEPVTRFNLEAPGGLIGIEAQCRAGKAERITFTNQPAFAVHLDQTLRVQGLGNLTVDIGYGGGFFVQLDATQLGFDVVPDEAAELCRLGEIVKRAAAEQFPVTHPLDKSVRSVTFTTWLAPPRVGGNGRNVNIVSPGRCDRSACGTGTSARMAILAAKGELPIGQDFVHESILDGHFVGRIIAATAVGAYPAIVPTISGRSWVYGVGELGRHTSDPLGAGYTLADVWRTEKRTTPLIGSDR